jgi:hypothetical protein
VKVRRSTQTDFQNIAAIHAQSWKDLYSDDLPTEFLAEQIDRNLVSSMKSTRTYWNPLADQNTGDWEIISGSDGNLSQLTIAEDSDSGDYTRLTKFKNGYSTEPFGAKSHKYPEEIFVVSGRLYDKAFDLWLEPGFYASRPPGEIHGPFIADGEVVILEMSYPSQSVPY